MTITSVLVQLCLTISLKIHKTACSINLFILCEICLYCVQTSPLICGAYWLTGFFAVRMSTDGVSRANYMISFVVSLALSLLELLRPLLIIFRYSVYLYFSYFFVFVFFLYFSMFFQYSELCFSNGFGQFWPSWPWRDVCWCHFIVTMAVLEHPFVYCKVFHFQRWRLTSSNIVWQWGVLTIKTLLVNKIL